jgi:hypothetical protein
MTLDTPTGSQTFPLAVSVTVLVTALVVYLIRE